MTRATHASVYIPTRLLYQFKPEGRFPEHLNGLPPPEGVRCHSFAAGHDLVVPPPESGLAPFGKTHLFEELGHLDIVLSPQVFSVVNDAPRTRT